MNRCIMEYCLLLQIFYSNFYHTIFCVERFTCCHILNMVIIKVRMCKISLSFIQNKKNGLFMHIEFNYYWINDKKNYTLIMLLQMIYLLYVISLKIFLTDSLKVDVFIFYIGSMIPNHIYVISGNSHPWRI